MQLLGIAMPPSRMEPKYAEAKGVVEVVEVALERNCLNRGWLSVLTTSLPPDPYEASLLGLPSVPSPPTCIGTRHENFVATTNDTNDRAFRE